MQRLRLKIIAPAQPLGPQDIPAGAFEEKTRNSPLLRGFRDSRQEGYIALMSVIVISVLLLSMTTNLGFSGFFTRLNVLDFESKERGLALVKACQNVAILDLAKGLATTGNIAAGDDVCTIISVEKYSPTSGQTTIKTQGVFNRSYTNLKVIINNSDFSVVSSEELTNL